MTKVTHTSPRKAAANRRNAAKSTGPRSPQGKSRSRLNALKHGILASRAVISTIEGHAERKMFEATVEGLEQDFQPVGTYEQLMLQEIAACFWRKRRLYEFENHAAFHNRDLPVTQLVRKPFQRDAWTTALYMQDGKLVTTEQVYDAAGLSGITLPSEADTNRVIRYEAAINRTRERAVKNLREMRKERVGMASHRAEVAPAVDRVAARRNASPQEAILLAPLFAIEFWRQLTDMRDEADQEQDAELRGQDSKSDREIDQTKPKTLSVDAVRRSLYRSIYGHEMPEEPATDPEKRSEPSEKPPEDPEKPPSA